MAVSSGTDANHLVLWGLGLKEGDEVIIPAKCCATAWGATLCGATPVFVDCEPDQLQYRSEKIEEKITPKTKAIVQFISTVSRLTWMR
ncbi:MAG: DegT/DnrJ/EryC1/StrS family aminotransferase [Ignavibacteria bacterium]